MSTARNWWMKLDKGTWRSDPRLSMCSPGTRGIWMDLLCALDDGETDRMEGTPAQFARCCRCSEAEALAAIHELRDTSAADVTQSGEIWTVVCRRMTREKAISGTRREAAKQRWDETEVNMDAKAMQTPCKSDANGHAKAMQNPSFNSCSSSLTQEGVQGGISDLAELVYAEYPRRVGKGAALKAIRAAAEKLGDGKDMPKMEPPEALEFLRTRARTYARSPAGKQGKYTPHPATWFNQQRYLDDDSEWEGGANDKHREHTGRRDERGGHANRGQQRVDEAISELAKAGVEVSAGRPEDGAGEVRPAAG